MHPWEFYEYSLDELVLRLKGINENKKFELQQLYQHVRMQAYYSLIPHLKSSAKNKPIDEIIPDIYDPKPAKVVSIKEKYKELKDKYLKYGFLNGS